MVMSRPRYPNQSYFRPRISCQAFLYFDSLLVRGPQKCSSSCIPLINGFGYFDIIDRLKSSMELLVVHLDTHQWGAGSLVNNDRS